MLKYKPKRKGAKKLPETTVHEVAISVKIMTVFLMAIIIERMINSKDSILSTIICLSPILKNVNSLSLIT